MCRITGIYHKDNSFPQVIEKMTGSLAHGGPDNQGIYFNFDETLALGHRRLSIIDLSAKGNQPMRWNNWVLCFNGEIYNYKEVKKQLPEYTFQSDCDSEILLKAFDKWGIRALDHFRGMFAFALYNEKTEKLILARDRVGVKPLYWYKKGNLFMFASELKAFHEHPDFDKSINPNAVSFFLKQGYIHAPHCIFKYAHHLEPGHVLEIDDKLNLTFHEYWKASDFNKPDSEFPTDENELIEKVENVLQESFQLRMVSDVPVGMFLSGGIDSTLVTAMIQNHTNASVNTFTIGFEDEQLNEAHFAKRISEHLDTNHTELYCTEKDALEIIPQLADIYDEPFGDSSAIPTFLVSQLAKEKVKVSLSADGGDELFGGYTKYEIAQKFHTSFGKIPSFVKTAVAKTLNQIDPEYLERYGKNLPFLNRYSDIKNKFSKLQKSISAENVFEFFDQSSCYLDKSELSRYGLSDTKRLDSNPIIQSDRLLSSLGLIDIQTYLHGDIMTKVDRATMHVALEGREPFLDHKIIETALQIPDNLKIRNGQSKYILRQILYNYVPKELIERPKMGFSIPVKKWLKTILRPNLERIQSDNLFFETFGLNKDPFYEDIDAFINDKYYINPHSMWFVFILHQWYERWIK